MWVYLMLTRMDPGYISCDKTEDEARSLQVPPRSPYSLPHQWFRTEKTRQRRRDLGLRRRDQWFRTEKTRPPASSSP